MTRTVPIAVVAVTLTAVLFGCGASQAYAGNGEPAVVSSNPGASLGSGDHLGENMFRHYAEVTRNRQERLAKAQAQASEPSRTKGSFEDASSDNLPEWFVVLPDRGIFVHPGTIVLQPVDGNVREVEAVHQLLPS